MTAPDMAVDVGNSRIKVAIRHGGGIVKVLTLSHGCENFHDVCVAEAMAIAGEVPYRWILAGVVPAETERLNACLIRSGGSVCWLNHHSKIGMRLSVVEPSRVGVDRLLSAKAAYHLALGKPCMIVDAGTALTINWVDGAGIFQGGSIQPGWHLMAKSLGDGTAELPEVGSEQSSDSPWPAKNTHDAIQTGLQGAILGSVGRFWKRAIELDQDANLWFTGGGGEWISGHFSGISRFHPNLVLEGMFLAAS